MCIFADNQMRLCGSALDRLSLARLASSQSGSALHRLGLVMHRLSAALLASSQSGSVSCILYICIYVPRGWLSGSVTCTPGDSCLAGLWHGTVGLFLHLVEY